MEKLKKISKFDFNNGVFIELECCMCLNKQTIAAETTKELNHLIKECGWSVLESDMYALIGYYDGCDYRD